MLRQRSGLSKAELAKLLGFASERMVQKWEGGYTLPTAERLRQLIEIYHARNGFVSGKELEEVGLLWLTIQNYSDATHPSYEGYPVFDVGWFEKLFKEQPASALPILPLHSAGSKPPPLEQEAEKGEKFLTNLPLLELTRFIGRQKELATLAQLLQQPQHRLVTLTGTGGIGKTRLALQAGRQSLPNFKDGVWLVELADVFDPKQWLEKALQMQEERQNYYEIAKSLTWLICINYQEGKTEEAQAQAHKLTQLLAATTGVLELHYRAELAKLPFSFSQFKPTLTNLWLVYRLPLTYGY